MLEMRSLAWRMEVRNGYANLSLSILVSAFRPFSGNIRSTISDLRHG